MTRRLVGIGDLHLDSKLKQYAPDINRLIESEVRHVLLKARRSGVDTAILYGDLCERAVMTDEGKAVLTRLFVEFKDMHFLVIKGNHDASDTESCSLDLLAEQARLGLFNATFALHTPHVAFADTDYPINLLPWPLTDTHPDMLNVLHTEAAGTTWETGRAVESGFSTKHLCVVGHIHKAQVVRNTHFSGTLYQTSFGEPPDKFFHQIAWTGNPKTSRVKQVQHSPFLRLTNEVIRSMDDYRKLLKDCESSRQDTTHRVLRKVFFKAKDLVLPPEAFADAHGVVKTQGFESTTELTAMLREDLELDDASHAARWDMMTSLKSWLSNTNAEDAVKRRAYHKARALAKLATPTQSESEE